MVVYDMYDMYDSGALPFVAFACFCLSSGLVRGLLKWGLRLLFNLYVVSETSTKWETKKKFPQVLKRFSSIAVRSPHTSYDLPNSSAV